MSRIPGYLNGIELWGLGSLGDNLVGGRRKRRRKMWKQYLTPEQQAEMQAHRAQRKAARKERLSKMTREERKAWRAERRAKKKARREARKAARQERKAVAGKTRLTREQRQARWDAMTEEQRRAKVDRRFQRWQSRRQKPATGLNGYIWF